MTAFPIKENPISGLIANPLVIADTGRPNQFVFDGEHSVITLPGCWLIPGNEVLEPGANALVKDIFLDSIKPGHEILLGAESDSLTNNPGDVSRRSEDKPNRVILARIHICIHQIKSAKGSPHQ